MPPLDPDDKKGASSAREPRVGDRLPAREPEAVVPSTDRRDVVLVFERVLHGVPADETGATR